MPPSNYYTANTFIDGEYISSSDVFRTRRRAQKFCDHMSTNLGNGISGNVEYIVFKSRPMPPKIYLDHDEDAVDHHEMPPLLISLDGMWFEDYSKGYMLYAPTDSWCYGEKYLLNGWWNTTQKGWFFKKEYFDDLFELGAEYIIDSASGKSKRATRANTKTPKKISPKKISPKKIKFDFSDMTFEEYGKGYLLHSSEDHSLFGEKYLLSGWWMPKHNAWFFQKKFYDELIEYGAQFISMDESDDGDVAEVTAAANALTSMDLSSMTVEEYGRGYILTPQKTHPSFGHKYFREGWWRPDLHAWFFREQFLDGLIADGAMFIEDDA
jgi:hypothetical protein